MKITFDPAKRNWTLENRGIDFFDAAKLLEGPTFSYEDDRKDYGERRIVTFGLINGRMFNLVWTERPGGCHVISMRKANDREKERFKNRLG
jgi:uncharacterized protein